jgi:hypothetical protein
VQTDNLKFCLIAGGLLCCNAPAFSSLKKIAPHFFNFTVGETKEKKVAYATIGRI